jgi:hypothetical protein
VRIRRGLPGRKFSGQLEAGGDRGEFAIDAVAEEMESSESDNCDQRENQGVLSETLTLIRVDCSIYGTSEPHEE